MNALGTWLKLFNTAKLDANESSHVTPVQMMASFIG